MAAATMTGMGGWRTEPGAVSAQPTARQTSTPEANLATSGSSPDPPGEAKFHITTLWTTTGSDDPLPTT
jgi:hypothetical protein